MRTEKRTSRRKLDNMLSRKERERLLRRQEIIVAARDVFAERGFNEATLEEIASKAEFGKGTLYGYFQNKSDLFEAVILEGLDDLLEMATRCCGDESLSLENSYKQFARELLSYLLNNRGFFILLMREVHRGIPRTTVTEHFPRIIGLLEGPLRRAMPRETSPSIDPAQIAFVFMTSIFTLFRSVALAGDSSCSFTHAREMTGTDADLDQIISVLDLTFFSGIRSLTGLNASAV